MVSFFPEQGIWKSFFIFNNWIVPYFQGGINGGKGTSRSLVHFLTDSGFIIADITAAFYQVRSLLASVNALSHKDLHYGSHATTEQVMQC